MNQNNNSQDNNRQDNNRQDNNRQDNNRQDNNRQDNNRQDNNRQDNNKNKRPANPKLITKSKYFKIGIRDSARVRIIKEGMNHLFDERNSELEEAFLQEAAQYTERVLGETRRFHWTEEEDHEAMNVIFNNSLEEPSLEEAEELINGEEEERLEAEADGEDDTLESEEVWELNERIQAEDQEEYERIRAELEEEEDEANKDN